MVFDDPISWPSRQGVEGGEGGGGGRGHKPIALSNHAPTLQSSSAWTTRSLIYLTLPRARRRFRHTSGTLRCQLRRANCISALASLPRGVGRENKRNLHLHLTGDRCVSNRSRLYVVDADIYTRIISRNGGRRSIRLYDVPRLCTFSLFLRRKFYSRIIASQTIIPQHY